MRLLKDCPTIVVLAALTMFVAACSQPAQSPQSGDKPATPPSSSTTAQTASPEAAAGGETPVDGDWLVMCLSDEPAHLNPLTSSDYYATSVMGFIFDSLLETEHETLAVKLKLAESYTVSDDHLTYTFKLRPNVTFSDGAPLTARDVKFTFDKVMDPTTDAPHLRNYYQDVASCEAVDDLTVRFTCKKPFFKHLRMLGGLEVLPAHIYGQGDFNSHPNNRKPVGSGPYVFESWDTGQQITLTRNEHYWQEKPHILKYVFKIIVDPNAAFQVLERQELDAMQPRPEQWVNQASKPEFEAKFSKYTYYAASYSYIGWNSRLPQFKDKMVRRALTLLLDRNTILSKIYYGLGRQVTGEFFVESPEYNKDLQPWPYDPAQAARLLDEAGWKDSDSDGVRDKDGVPFAFELMIRSGSPDDERIATVYQESLKAAGIKMTIRTLEWASFLERVDSRKFEAVRLGWSGPIIEGDPYQVWHSSQIDKGSNFVGFSNAEADKIMEDARLEFNQDKRVALYHRFGEILHEEQPYTFMFCRQDLDAVDKRFRNVKVYPGGLDSREWFVPKNLQRYK